ncbi:MAG: DUF6516 family protein [bacterium]
MLKTLKQFDHIIASWKIILHEREGDNYRTKIEMSFSDGSKLYAKDYVFEGEDRKYSYHWIDREENLLIRWDNAKHWRGISTFPHHKHIGTPERVEPSNEVTLDDVLTSIESQMMRR